jgi:hypothetical protein
LIRGVCALRRRRTVCRSKAEGGRRCPGRRRACGAGGEPSSKSSGVRLADMMVMPEMGFAGSVLAHGIEAVTQPRPRGADKPEGGLWLSPLRRDISGSLAATGWTDWCEAEGFDAGPAGEITPVRLAARARVAVIASRHDYDQLAAECGQLDIDETPYSGLRHLDWTAVSARFDAVWLTSEGVEAVAGTHDPLYGWDTESLLVLNREALTT